MSGWLQRQLEYGIQTGFEFEFGSMVLAAGVTQVEPLWLKIFSVDAGDGKNTNVAVEVYLGPARTLQDWYGSAVGKFPMEITLYYDQDTRALDTYPPNFATGDETYERATITIDRADEGLPAVYYAEWYDDMLKDFGQRVRTQLAAAAWTNAPEEPNAVLLVLDSDLERNDVKIHLENALVTVSGLQELDAEPDRQGGFGRKGRKLTCEVHIYVKYLLGMVSSEDTALKYCTSYLEDIRQELHPAGVPNRLDGYLYDGRIESGEKPSAVKIDGVDLVHASLTYVGYKFQIV